MNEIQQNTITYNESLWQSPIYSDVISDDYSNQPMKPKTTTSLWDDEGTLCYQIDVHGICVARRQDNDMINGTKLLNVTGMSRGKRDGILKNEKGRVVVKVGAMHLKGVWVTFARAKALAIQYSILDYLFPLFVDNPAVYFYSNQLSFIPPPPPPIQTHTHTPPPLQTHTHTPLQHPYQQNQIFLQTADPVFYEYDYYHSFLNDLLLAPSVPSMLPQNYSVDKLSF